MKTINTIKLILIIQLILTLFVGCTDKSAISNNFISDFSFSTKKYVDLFDYKSIHIEADYIQVTNQDIETAINNDLSYYECYKPINKDIISNDDIVLLQTDSQNKDYCFDNYYYIVGSSDLGNEFDSSIKSAKVNDTFSANISNNINLTVKIKGIYTYATCDDTDIVCSYYNLDNMDEVYKKIKERTKNEIIFNFMYDKILENSNIISCPPIVDDYINRYENEIKNDAEKENLDVEEYAESNSGMTLSDMLAYRRNYYYEIMIINAILENENNQVTTYELENNIKITSQENNISENAVKEKYLEDVYYNSIYNKLKETIVKYIIIDSE